MKIEGYRRSRTGDKEIIGVFAFGLPEALCLYELVNNCKTHMPHSEETNPMHSRLNNLSRALRVALDDWKLTRHSIVKIVPDQITPRKISSPKPEVKEAENETSNNPR